MSAIEILKQTATTWSF